ncbi:MAG: hypothetical protein LBJ41_05805 [Treponema sp.]|jgi:hypothetical protein|nr:hypothetical protein [Treponema sp.]
MNTALTRVDSARKSGALVYVNPEHYEAQVELYKTEITELHLKKDDFHVISGKYMPKKETVDKISESAGITFIQSSSRSHTETRDESLTGKRTVHIAEEQGKVRMPDGSYRESTVEEYEFDPFLRAMIDKRATEITPQNRVEVTRVAMEYSKCARQRAKTGARSRVVRQLTGMPTAFDVKDLGMDAEGNIRPMLFSRVVQNTSYILQTPEGRAMATAQALGVDVASLFGTRKLALTPSVGATEPSSTADMPELENEAEKLVGEAAAEGAVDGEPDFPVEADTQQQEETEFARLTLVLEEYMTYKEYLDMATKSGSNPYELAEAEINNKSATEESRRKMVKRIRDFLVAKKVLGVA